MHVHNIIALPDKPYSATIATEVTSSPDEGQDIWARITPACHTSTLLFNRDIENGLVIAFEHYATTTNATLFHLYIRELSPAKASEIAEDAISTLLQTLNAIENNEWSEM